MIRMSRVDSVVQGKDKGETRTVFRIDTFEYGLEHAVNVYG
jgi:hypothetical protein